MGKPEEDGDTIIQGREQAHLGRTKNEWPNFFLDKGGEKEREMVCCLVLLLKEL